MSLARGIEIVDQGFTFSVKKESRLYRRLVLLSLARALNNIRISSMAYILPNTTGTRNPYVASKLQPSSSSRLTSRTGTLIKMLKDKVPNNSVSNWKIGTKRATMESDGIKGLVKVTAGFNTLFEEYQADLRVNVKTGERFSIPTRNAGGRARIIKITKQQKAIRFKHDKGIRGTARPFITPATKEEFIDLPRLMGARLRQLKGF